MSGQDDLQPEQYEAVLRYMEAANIEDFESALHIMKENQYNFHNAMNRRYRSTGGTQPMMAEPIVRQQNNGEEQLKQYLQFLRERRNQSMFLGIFNFVKKLIVSLFSGLVEIFIPEFILKKIMRSAFYTTYKDKISVKVVDHTLTHLLKQAYMSRKPIIMCIASPNGRHQSLLTLLTTPNIVNKINESFIFTGAMIDNPEVNKIQGDKQPPSFIIVRMNIFEKMEIVSRFVGQDSIRAINIDKLNEVLKKHQRACRKDRNIAVRYRNYIRRTYYARPGVIYQEQQQEQLYPEWQTSSSEMIQFQNQEYNKVKQEALMKQKQEMQEKQKLQEVVAERKARKMSIPDEPQEGDIIRINFRTPDGETVTRNFSMDDKLQLIYAWVETNDEIQFQENEKRQFELMYSFPPTSLCSRKHEYLKDVFDSNQEKIMIREL